MAIIYKDDIPVVLSYSQIGMEVLHAESYETRLERRLEWQDKNHKVANVIAVRERPEGPRAIKTQHLAANLVTNDGEIAYAQKAAGETPTNDFWHATNPKWQVRDNATALTPNEGDSYTVFTNPVAGSLKSRTAGYPKSNDTGDADNTGDSAQSVSWAVSYTTSDFSATNVSGVIYTSVASPTTGSPLLFHAAFSPVFAKASTDTLKIFENAQMENQ